MACNQVFEDELHHYLNHELTYEEEINLKHHIMSCRACQKHYQELKRVDQKLSDIKDVEVPSDLKCNIMAQLPKDSRFKRGRKIVKEHPMISAAVAFFIMLFISTLMNYHSNQQMSLSKHEGVVTQGDRVIIPEGEIIEGDFIVRNAEVVLEGQIRGNLTLVNSQVIDHTIHHGDQFNKYNHHVEGKVVEIDQYVHWIYHKAENEIKSFMTFVTP
ncbi:zf-HC2 domain-containing protein [Aquisalibacillus elongatus]|uniref:Putative zinc finger protein n=1 Tax=Aquisalibacillus elongatus TaxID=485577 RepID=A0A3N5C295_9BACI|nr:zf-HC2 domain-containing protein [Aquisalibacillus elongatus]RPF53492.1 putative zinc finger protein [Aquisalibacillus elongatus]